MTEEPIISAQPWWQTPQLALPVAMALAFILRAALAIVHPMLFPDSADYNFLARAILAGHNYEVHGLFASRLPGYPVYIAGIYALCGPWPMAVLLTQALCGSLTTLLVFLVAGRISTRVAITAAFIMAVDPLSVAFSAALLSEIPFTLVLMLGLWWCIRLMENPRGVGLWVLLGITWGIATYLRGEVILLLLPLLGWVGWYAIRMKSQRPIRVYLKIMLVLAVLLACLLPWWIRNYRLFGQDFFRMSTLQGISLYEAVYPQATGGPQQSDIPVPAALRHLNESQRDLAWTRRAWHCVAAHPLRMAKLAVIKVARTWSPWLNARHYQFWWLNTALILWNVPVFILAVLGLVGRKKEKIPAGVLGILVLPILYFTMMHALFIGSVRYRVELLPLVDMLAAVGIFRLVAKGHAPGTESAGVQPPAS